MTAKRKKTDTFVTQLDSNGNPIPVTAPKTLDNHPFFGIKVDEEQKIFRDSIWNPDIDIVFCNAKAGTGKTLIAVATAVLLKEYNLIDEIIYISAAGNYETKQGLLPGTLEEKSFQYQIPLRQALIKLGYSPEQVIYSESNMTSVKNGTAFIRSMTDSWIRGWNCGDEDSKILMIVEESQNYTNFALKTVLTRLGIGSKAVVIGHTGQIDLKYPQDSGFEKCIHLFEDQEFSKVCNLTKSHRSKVAIKADEL